MTHLYAQPTDNLVHTILWTCYGRKTREKLVTIGKFDGGKETWKRLIPRWQRHHASLHGMSDTGEHNY